jgi:hypothetical protein
LIRVLQLTHFMKYLDGRDEKWSSLPGKFQHFCPDVLLQQHFTRLPFLNPQW